jgi:aspartate/tyrosine/aromatic aminotransferase
MACALRAAGKTRYAAGASIVLLHPCCHNPTGADFTNAQWEVVEVLKARNLIPFLDIAYQGFGGGGRGCLRHPRHCAGMPMLVSNSFSKIFSLYGERVGGLSVVCEDAKPRPRAGAAESDRAPQLLQPAELCRWWRRCSAIRR